MWLRFVFFGLCCLVTVCYTAYQVENLDSTSSVLENEPKKLVRSTRSEDASFDRMEKLYAKQKEQNQESLKSSNRVGKEETGSSTDSTEDYDEGDVCYPNLGCFKMGKPWKSLLRPIEPPDSPVDIQTTIHFYSRPDTENQKNITIYPTVDMGKARFDPNKKTVMIIHGFSSSGSASWLKDMKNAYLKEEDVNAMIVDWGEGAQRTNYLQVAGNTRVVGRELALFVQYLIENFGADPKKFHVIGHSLGAQISSYLGRDVRGIGRLTALDPAQPGFEGFDEEVRLDKSDAEFIDVIHTDAKPFIPTLGFGMISPQGHVDFYVNGGYAQPGCIGPKKPKTPIKALQDLGKFTVEVLSELISCSHGKAYEYFTESLNRNDNCVFWGHKADTKNIFKSVTNTLTQGLIKEITALSPTCSEDNCIPLGFDTEKYPLRGAFVITTNKKEPYCIAEVPQRSKMVSLLHSLKEKIMSHK